MSGMGLRETAYLRTLTKLFAGSAVAVILFIPTTACHISQKKTDLGATEGFDFSFSSDETDPSVGPKIGERIDLTGLKARDGAILSSMDNHQLIMLVTVDPQCGACKVAADEIQEVQGRVEGFGLPYYLVSFTSSKAPAVFFEYTDSFAMSTPAFYGTGTRRGHRTRFIPWCFRRIS
jgi:hypothetical protein